MFAILLAAQTLKYFTFIDERTDNECKLYDGNDRFIEYESAGMGEYMPASFNGIGMDTSMEEYQTAMDPNNAVNKPDLPGLTIGPLSASGTRYSILVANPTSDAKTLYFPLLYYRGYYVIDKPYNPESAEDSNTENTSPSDTTQSADSESTSATTQSSDSSSTASDNVDAAASGTTPRLFDAVTGDANTSDLDLFETDLGTVAVNIPAGYFGGIIVDYWEPSIFRIYELISLLTLIAITIVGDRRTGR